MSNYPPGVSGLEPHLTGPVERDHRMKVAECTRLDFERCDFTGGDVNGVLSGDHLVATFWWDCPVCNAENSVVDVEVEGL